MMNSIRCLSIAALLLSASACSAQEPTAQAQTVQTTVTASNGFFAQESAWRTVDPENLILIDTDYGRIGVELYTEIAPKHTDRIRTLARRKFYDGLLFHRVIEDFMNQTGDPTGTGSGDSDLPNLEGEFTFRRATNTMPVTIISARQIDPRNPSAGEIGVGFYKALPVATQPAAQAIATKDGKVAANGLHCKGVTSMARTSDPNSANSQFFLMRGPAQWLDGTYSVWGNTVIGYNLVERFKVGTAGETPDFEPDKMNRVTVAADWPEATRPYPDICDIRVPTRLVTK